LVTYFDDLSDDLVVIGVIDASLHPLYKSMGDPMQVCSGLHITTFNLQ
jgi:hypothetical protein